MHLLQVRQPFSVRIMIPCYKEDIETLEETLECAIEAAKVSIDKGMANAGMSHSCSKLAEVQQRLWHQTSREVQNSCWQVGGRLLHACQPLCQQLCCCGRAGTQHASTC